MAIAYKGFVLSVVEASTYTFVETLGRFEFCFVTANGNIYGTNSAYNQTNLINAIDAENGYRNNITGAGVGGEDLTRISYLREILPATSNFPYTYNSNYRLKLTAANGSYAIAQSAYATNFQLFTSDGESVGFFPFETYRDSDCTAYAVIANFDGTLVPVSGTVHCIIPRPALQRYAVQNSSFTLTQAMADWFNGITPLIPPPPEDDDPYSEIDGESEITGGGIGIVGIPGFPALSATSTGIIGLFAPSVAEMQLLADFMWTDTQTPVTPQDMLSSVVSALNEVTEAVKRTIANPLDYVIGLNIIPSQGLSVGASQNIKFGFVNSGVSMPRLANQYFTVDCGSLYFGTLCGDTFLDYAPYSKFSIYLPYIGVKEVDANDFVGHTIGVVYHGDTVTGGVTAYITKDGSVMYQYSGCCALNIPLSADNWGNTISGAVQIATSLVAAGATGGAAGVGLAAAKGAASVAANPSLLSPRVQHSGAVSGGAGCMAVQYPFVIREAVRFHSTSYFNTISGYPAFYYRSLGDVTGFTTVVNVHLENIPATQGEIAEIEKLLKEGVIL